MAFSATTPVNAQPPVLVSENQSAFTLGNGIVTAQVSKRSGDLVSLTYKNQELLEARSGHPFGYWEQDTSHGRRMVRVTIDPKTNGGERGEVSVKSIYIPDASGEGGVPGSRYGPACDVEIRYTLERDLPGIYAYEIFTHQTNYPATEIGEGRFAVKLKPAIFNYLNVDANRRKLMPAPADWLAGTELSPREARRLNTGIDKGHVEHKYDYSADQFDTRAYGWLGTQSHIGFWFINPSVEYLSGGPTKYELTGHLDISDEAAPVLLNYWRSSHYGGAVCVITNGEAWTKVIGPFLIYCNSGQTPDAMWRDALERAAREEATWPCDWVGGVDYPHKASRANVSGQLLVHDPQEPELAISNLRVGLTAPDYPVPSQSRGLKKQVGGRFSQFRVGSRIVTWQADAKHYEFWVRGDSQGHFTIPNVDPGYYTLHAIADGVLGEFTRSNVSVAAGQMLDLGKLKWEPVRYGKQLWDIGIPNRSGSEFFKGNDYHRWGWYLRYAKLFPNDIDYVMGKSDFREDWFFEQVPHNENPDDTNGRGRGRSTTWTVAFNLPETPHGTAILRLAICGSGARTIRVTVNGKEAGVVQAPPYNATINRDGIEGTWTECDLGFEASLLKSGTNKMGLTIPAGSLTSGIIYDYLRLELNESAMPLEGPAADDDVRQPYPLPTERQNRRQ